MFEDQDVIQADDLCIPPIWMMDLIKRQQFEQKKSLWSDGPKNIAGKNQSRWYALKDVLTAKSSTLLFEDEKVYRRYIKAVEKLIYPVIMLRDNQCLNMQMVYGAQSGMKSMAHMSVK